MPDSPNNGGLSSNLKRLLPRDDNSLQLNDCVISCAKQERALLFLLSLIIDDPEEIGV